MNELLQACFNAAQEIVAKEKELYPNSEGIVAFDVSVEGGTTSTEFQRQGTSEQQKQYQLPADLAALIESNYKTSRIPSSLTDSEVSFLQGLFTLVQSAIPGLSVLSQNQGINPTTFGGSSTLSSIAGQNPYSTDWENQTQGAYERTFDIARAKAASGPENVRGGQARAAYELSDTNTAASLNRFREVNDQQRATSGVVTDAIRTAQAIENARRGTAMTAQAQEVNSGNAWRSQGLQASGQLTPLRANSLGQMTMASEFLSSPKLVTSDNLSGKGNQSHFNWGAGTGIQCCWIFIAATGGNLPWWVRYCRNHLGNDTTRRGYRRMARWLVPLMERWTLVRLAVEALITYPITCYGGYLVHEPGYENGFVFRPVKRLWFYIWNKLGKD